MRHRDLRGNRRRRAEGHRRRAPSPRSATPPCSRRSTVIAAILPMAFVGGLMGPYMRPIPVGATAAMVFSLVDRVRGHAVGGGAAPAAPAAATAHVDRRERPRHPRLPLAHVAPRRPLALALVVPRASSRLLLVGAMALVPARAVRVKMLPYDNKSELEIVLNMPEDSSLERTAAGGARDRRRRARRARGDRLPDLRRHRRALQLQRPGAPLLPARRARASPTCR